MPSVAAFYVYKKMTKPQDTNQTGHMDKKYNECRATTYMHHLWSELISNNRQRQSHVLWTIVHWVQELVHAQAEEGNMQSNTLPWWHPMWWNKYKRCKCVVCSPNSVAPGNQWTDNYIEQGKHMHTSQSVQPSYSLTRDSLYNKRK